MNLRQSGVFRTLPFYRDADNPNENYVAWVNGVKVVSTDLKTFCELMQKEFDKRNKKS
jgi:hypothetical protein